LAGIRTFSVALPLEHFTLAGSPRSRGELLKVQVVARLTEAVTVIVPPADGRLDLLSRSDVTAGLGACETAAAAGAVTDASKAAIPAASAARRRPPVPVIYGCLPSIRTRPPVRALAARSQLGIYGQSRPLSVVLLTGASGHAGASFAATMVVSGATEAGPF
jgi:anti-sigma factor RsiW